MLTDYTKETIENGNYEVREWPLYCVLALLVLVSHRKYCIHRVPELGSPHPLPRKRVCLPPWTQRGEEQHSLAGEGPNSDDWKESLALWILCIEPEVLAVL